ncbi:MAG: ABC transporter permease subunit [Thermoleophilia bacterium]
MPGSVLARTLADNRRALLWWTVGLVGLVGFVVAVYPTVRDRPELDRLLEDYPELLKAFLGGGQLDFTSPAGYLSNELFSFMAPLVLLVFAIGRGAAAVAGEEERGTIDLLLACPLSRSRLVLERAGALAALLLALGLALWLALVALAAIVGMEIGATRLGQGVASSLLLALHFGALALLVGAATGRRALALSLAAGAAVLAYLVNALALLVDFLEPWRRFSPVYHAIGTEPLRVGLGWDHVLVLGGASVAMVAVAALAFERRDVR